MVSQLEFGNVHDSYAVAVCKPGSSTSISSSSLSTVGHVPRNISTLCHFFIRRLGTITCQVTGSRRYASDLPQGGLEGFSEIFVRFFLTY